MKQITYYLLAAFLLGACTEVETYVEDVDQGTSVPLAINGLGMSVETRAIVDDVSNDGAANHLGKIGVLVTKAKGSGVELYSTKTPQTYTYDGTLWTPGDALNLANAEGTLYAWAPTTGYTGSLLTNNPVIKSIKILDTQQINAGTNEWDTDQEDLLYGSSGEAVGNTEHHKVSKAAPAVENLYMQHALCKISFRIMKGDGQTVNTSDFVKQIELADEANSSFLSSARPTVGMTMSLADGVFSGLIATKKLTLNMLTKGKQAQVAAYAVDYANVTVAQAYGLVAPKASGEMAIQLTVGPEGALNAATDRTYKNSQPLAGVVWERGKHYVYRITVTDQGLKITDVSVVGWGEGAITDVPVE